MSDNKNLLDKFQENIKELIKSQKSTRNKTDLQKYVSKRIYAGLVNEEATPSQPAQAQEPDENNNAYKLLQVNKDIIDKIQEGYENYIGQHPGKMTAGGVKNINSDVKKFMKEAKKYLRNAKKGGDDSQFDLFVAARAVQDAYNKSDSFTKKELEKTVESMNSTLSFIIEKNSKS